MTNPTGKRWRPHTPMATFRENQAEESRAAERLRMAGWPVMRGTPEEREQRYLKALYEGLRGDGRVEQ